jgi:hypothetical protein
MDKSKFHREIHKNATGYYFTVPKEDITLLEIRERLKKLKKDEELIATITIDFNNEVQEEKPPI